MLQTRLFPSPNHQPLSIPLSILDATVARFTPTGAIWVFDAFTSNETVFLEYLQTSFTTTLNSFPHWAGQLQWTQFHPEGDHTQRSHRPMVAYNTESDPGVEWNIVKHARPLESLAPTATQRASTGIWVGDAFAQNILLSQTQLALHNLHDWKGLPSMTVQINLFNDGGFAVGMQIAHCLADAQALMVFVHQWAATCRTLHGQQDSISLMGEPVFQPSMLDSQADGDIDAKEPNPVLTKTARDLPLHRFDWWKMSDPGYPPFLIPTTENSKPSPECLAKNAVLSPSQSPPWKTWDLTRPISYAKVHFTDEELGRIRDIARAGCNGSTISRLDALLAHTWAAISRARGLIDSSEEVFLNVTLSARPRVSPPLPDSFIGSPIFLTHIRNQGSVACTASVGETASQLRETIRLFTPEKVGAILHDAAHEVAPQRLWQGFLGTRHTLVTSWLRLGMYEVDFEGRGQTPRYAHAVMPKMDGCVQVMDSGTDDGGVDLALYLDVEAMGKLLEDGRLRVLS
ncbi:hypothetical protein ASPWEDRAFT_268474 [Aspergillus wentii DTO 134E9]|uniref:Transferase family protein n=1 Tax=Aspergillus wentii DTO 134E9 TaxID=1073089 RepID=A0A1L9S2R3_ASPWE|nr:uncharacterized protein ASPWEDRAFT_268474 [Aspergillus wentii DTO 134E9]KAI9924489.1 hypothetical protein MW887_007116 [Aspergillus wentii]OJJ41450.1 hypothetical protein ASPWEDRAFT_268474 [Aspergillus wentii DTO 134E9]